MPNRAVMPFSLKGAISNAKPWLQNPFIGGVERVAEKLSGLDWLNRQYAAAPEMDEAEFIRYVMSLLKVDYQVNGVERIPESGGVVVVANHPFGAIEGVMLAEIMRKRREDVKILANGLLQRIPELGERLIGVDVFGGSGARQQNSRPMREALRWVAKGGALVVFPAGEVAHLNPFQFRVEEPVWQAGIGRLIQATGASVVPIAISGRNSGLFQLAGLVHPRLRTLLLPRELINKRGQQVMIEVGPVVSARRLQEFGDAKSLIDYLRMRTEVLRQGAASKKFEQLEQPSDWEPVEEATPSVILAREIAALPERQCLVPGEEMQVYYARARQMPSVLAEIGRLREITFRAVGEGTGRSTDLDLYDNYYTHLFVWNAAKQEVVGAYRLGRADRIMRHYGKKGLYSFSLFQYPSRLLNEINPAIELGRSFVRQEYQRSFAPLMLLWKGIGQYIARKPRYKILFGPVSISQDYQNPSQRLLIEYLKASHSTPELAKLVKPRRPFRGERWMAKLCKSTPSAISDMDSVTELVTQLEPDGKGIPILLKQYLKMGGRLLAFNVDKQFNDAVDGLIMVDLTATDPKVLRRYMGDAADTFLAWHAADQAEHRLAS